MEDLRSIDLHAHTCCSDGSLSPTELVQLAAERGLVALAVTDHDTVAGVAEALAAGERYGVEVIPGIELSTMEEGYDVHMVGLFVDPENPGLQEALAEIVRRRIQRNERMVDRLIGLGLPISREDVAAQGGGVLTRGNLAQILVEHGAAPSVREAMNRYLVKGRPGYEPKVAPTPAEAAEILHRAGGLAFVAHFHQIDRGDLVHSAEIARSILRAGADGLETRYSEFTPEMQGMAEEIAEEFGCLRSGGSDFHGKLKPGLELGTGYEDLRVPYSYLQAMKEHRAAALHA
ncbi:MAG: PHP domain-containing protein [Lachnospiraceae bacterium]|nr:PHP domain-containing protein [Lachnospiraceae bacterium]